MSISYSKKAIETLSGRILRAKAGDSKARKVYVQEMDSDSIALLAATCRSRGLYGAIGRNVYSNIGDIADRMYTVTEFERHVVVSGVEAEGYIKLTYSFKDAAMKEAFASAKQSQELLDALAEKKRAFIQENDLVWNKEFEDIAFRTKEDEEAYIEKKKSFSGEIRRWRDEFDHEVKTAFLNLRDGVTGESAVIRTKPSKYKGAVYVAVHLGGKVIAWISRDGYLSMQDSDGVVLQREKMSPADSWFEGASALAAKEYIRHGGTFSQFIPSEL